MTEYAVYWASPRGFENEGLYIYGEEQQACDAACTVLNEVDSEEAVELVSTHKSMAAAQRRAERESKLVGSEPRLVPYHWSPVRRKSMSLLSEQHLTGVVTADQVLTGEIVLLPLGPSLKPKQARRRKEARR
jgi:ribosomal protein L44E